jgi:SET domain-containing protein
MKIPTYPGITVGRSDIEGVGIIAEKDFNKGELLLPLEGRVIKSKNPHEELDELTFSHAVPIGRENGKYIFIGQPSLSNYFNHSCSPNAGFKDTKEFVAMTKIKKGEEIVIDYAMCNIDGFKMACYCGSKNCRKEVVSFEDLDSKTQKKYLPYVIPYIKDEFLIHHK